MTKAALVLAMTVLSASPAFAFFHELPCVRDITNGKVELTIPQMAAQWDSYRIVFQQDFPGKPQMSPQRPNKVFGMCLVEGHWSRIPEPPPVRIVQ